MIDRHRLIDRERELDFLESSWHKPAGQMLIVLGRRRVGKTALLRHFAQRHAIVHFAATED